MQADILYQKSITCRKATTRKQIGCLVNQKWGSWQTHKESNNSNNGSNGTCIEEDHLENNLEIALTGKTAQTEEKFTSLVTIVAIAQCQCAHGVRKR